MFRRAATRLEEDVRAEVGAVGPDDGAYVGIDSNLAKIMFVLELFENSIERDQLGNVDLAMFATFKGQEKAIAAECMNANNILMACHAGTLA